MIGRILNFWTNLGSRVKQHLKQWTKPATAVLVTETLSDITRSRADLVAEHVMLRQQLIVLNLQVKRPQLTVGDRIGWDTRFPYLIPRFVSPMAAK